MFYNHIQALGHFQKGLSGLKVFQTNILIDLNATKSEYNFEEKSTLERNYAVGLYVTAPEETPQKVTQIKTAAKFSVFASSYLELRRDQEIIYARLPLLLIKKANDQGHPFPLYLGERINLSESKLIINNNAGITANEVIEINADYVKLAR